MSTPIINAIISGPSLGPRTYKYTVVLGSEKLKDQILYPNTKYIIRHNFDLENQEIVIPENCIIEIDGGSVSNGTLTGNNTILLNANKTDNILNNITLAGTWGPQDQVCEPDVDNLSVLYFDKTTRKILWWDGENFIEHKVI